MNAKPTVDKPTFVAAEFLIGYRDLTRSLGGNPELFLEQAGLKPSVLDQVSARIPLELFSDVLETTAEALDCPDFGMRLAEIQSNRPFAPLDRLISNAPTIGDVIALGCGYSEAYTSGITSFLERDKDSGIAFLRVEYPEPLAGKIQLIEQFALLGHNGIIRLSGGKARARGIWFLHAPCAPPVAYARQFRTPIRFRQDIHGLFFSDADMRTQVIGRDEGVFQKERELFAARLPEQPMPIEMRVRLAVERAFVEGSCTRERVAELTEMHERTLHRRLAAAGTSFQEIREQVRRKLALRYLAQPDLPLTDVTGRLGYSELAVLTRSCKRWFKTPPAELRRRLTHAAH